MSARLELDAAMTEKELFECVRAHLEMFGWRWYHTYDSRRSNGGFPDVVAVRNERVLFIELKSVKGSLRADQAWWLGDLEEAGEEVYVWRPSDLSSGLIERVLGKEGN